MYSTLVDAWSHPERRWPSVVYVETTNHCNARCTCCLNHVCQRERGTMTMDTFRAVLERVRERPWLRIEAMFCFGEPLLDPTLFDKYAAAREAGLIRTDHCGLNTNVSGLTPDKYEPLLRQTPNVTLSFFNVGKEYERMTGLSWQRSYDNARKFIKYRDVHKPEYQVLIGVNTVAGHDLPAVMKAFAGKNVTFVQDAEIRWGGSLVTGVLDRSIMYPWWRCDGCKGALQVKWNGDCEFCAYDIRGTPAGGETLFGNLLTDGWERLEESFRAKWRSCCSLCARCDYWHRATAVFVNAMRRPDPIPRDWYDWQLPLLQPGETIRD